MAGNSDNLNIDGVDLFGECLAQATLVVKQVLPAHATNATPDSELDVRDLTSHMLTMLESVPAVLHGLATEIDYEADELADGTTDLSMQWQTAADQAEATVAEIDLDDTVMYNGEQTAVENFLTDVAGDLLIHAWDLGEAIGMPVRFPTIVAEAVMETTVVPNKLMLGSHSLITESIDPPANADLQARLLALFGRSYAWRSAL